MPGPFPLLTDENVSGPLIKGLRDRGWDVVRVIDVFGQESTDEAVFAYAAEQGRVLASTDTDCLAIAHRWLAEGRTFRLLYWHQGAHQHVPVGHLLAAFEALAAKESAFSGCIEYLELESPR